MNIHNHMPRAQYPGDNHDLDTLGSAYTITTMGSAVDAVHTYLHQRVTDVLEATQPRHVGVSVSGGVDSLLTLAVVTQVCDAWEKGRIPVSAYTVDYRRDSGVDTDTTQADTAQVDTTEVNTAQAVCSSVGVPLTVLSPDASCARDRSLVTDVARRLGTGDIWEVGAGLLARMCQQAAFADGADVLFTGGGADTLFLGGVADAPDSPEAWWSRVKQEIRRTYIYDRPIPDFYERVLDHPLQYIITWQTTAAVELARQIHPDVVRADGVDKAVLRTAARSLGIDGLDDTVFSNAKHASQQSSGVIDFVVDCARYNLANEPAHTNYTSPINETDTMVAARLYLDHVRFDRVRSQ